MVFHKEIERLEKISETFSSLNGFNSRLINFRFRKIKAFFHGKSVLELGPADGQMTKQLIGYFKEMTVVDGSKTLLEKLKKIVKDKINIKCALFEDFSTQKKFDIILMAHVLEHVKNPVNLLKRYKRFLNKDGTIIITVPNALSVHRLIGVEMNLIKNPYELNESDYKIGHRRVYDSKNLKEDIEKARLKIIDSGGILFKPLSNDQMASFSSEIIEAFYRLSNKFSENCAELYAICKKNWGVQ